MIDAELNEDEEDDEEEIFDQNQTIEIVSLLKELYENNIVIHQMFD